MRRRVPLRRQLTTNECGAACLAMVLSYHGRDTQVAECRELLRPGRDGLPVAALVAGAEHHGLRASVERGPEPFDGPLPGPAIAYLSEHHYVVVTGVTDGHVEVADPRAGRRRLTRAAFAQAYGGVLIRLTPGPGFRRRAARTPPVMVRYLREFVGVPGGRRLLGAVVLLSAALQALGLALPLATKVVVDQVIPAGRDDVLTVLVTGVLGTALTYGLLTLVRSRLLLALRARADRRLTGRFVTHLLRLPLDFFLQRGRGDLLMRLSSVSTGRDAVTQQVLALGLDAVLLIGYVTALAFLSPWYEAAIGVLGAAQVCVTLGSYRRVGALSRDELAARTEEYGYLTEVLQAMLPVKANGVEARARLRWSELFAAYQAAMLRRGVATAWFEGAHAALALLGPLALLCGGVWLVLSGQLSLGTMLAANALGLSVLAPLQGFVGVVQMLSMLRGQVERIYDVLYSPPEASGSRVLPAGRPASLAARRLTFRYGPRTPAVLRDITFDVPAGAKLGVVGRTGSGKSTLALLVLGLLRPDSGEVCHDGVPVGELDLGELRRGCGAVLQELSLFNGSIRDNITLGDPGAADADVVAAATMAGLHDDVTGLPMGYDTAVGEGGAALSAGQRQRVALARALVHRPRLLILDEATSHLDPETERRVDSALSALRVTRIVISHRPSAIRNADEIVMLDAGRIVARGTHEELAAVPGPYRELFGDAPAATPVGGRPAGGE
ncbi:peptidase domain-containing ABC transporter [Nonomuraea angiospora]|uniref:peptidase domain-containing ABC transporter n=1 Tax=Nonomuraea angiospora TaxID=46172 RepID=UPI0029BCE4A9|nr:peptidase domain-containing ABC transporter [Nonomuraea angiospora]MDX3103486.1 peptidase domain-containing ABC transporter [Nonomuraea angiospora]